jgi:hypothetical protein
MINTLMKKSVLRRQLLTLEGWVDRVDHHKRQLHIRTGSRDRFGVCVLIPDHCEIKHSQHHLQLRSLLPCDPVSISYEEDDLGGRVAQVVEIG